MFFQEQSRFSTSFDNKHVCQHCPLNSNHFCQHCPIANISVKICPLSRKHFCKDLLITNTFINTVFLIATIYVNTCFLDIKHFCLQHTPLYSNHLSTLSSVANISVITVLFIAIISVNSLALSNKHFWQVLLIGNIFVTTILSIANSLSTVCLIAKVSINTLDSKDFYQHCLFSCKHFC